jgi:hypothetical protein
MGEPIDEHLHSTVRNRLKEWGKIRKMKQL